MMSAADVGAGVADEQHEIFLQTSYVDGDIKFYPPAYIQRYDAVKRILLDERWKSRVKKLADLGCGELGLFNHLKTLVDINKVIMVDIDKATLETNACRAAPLNCDYLNPRATPLSVDVLCGSVADHDVRLLGCDAVTCVEIIEHLEEDIVEMLVSTVFGFIQPQVAIFTTPNADFNVLFKDFKRFRHWDHKFEWTRAEFKKWTDNVLSSYPHYKVEIQGVGNPPPGKETVGHCSQIAVFIRDEEYIPCCTEDPKEIYSKIRAYEHPVAVPDLRSDEEKLRDEAMYIVHTLSHHDEYRTEYDEIYIPLDEILHLVQRILPNTDKNSLVQALEGQVKVCDWQGVTAVHYDFTQSDTDDPDEDNEEYISGSPSDDDENWQLQSAQPQHNVPLLDYQEIERSNALAHHVLAIEENLTNLSYERQRAGDDSFHEAGSYDAEHSDNYESDYDDFLWQPSDCERPWNAINLPCSAEVRSGIQPAPGESPIFTEEGSDGHFDNAEELQLVSETASSPSAILDCKREPITDSGVDLSPLLASAPPSEDDLLGVCCRLNVVTQDKKVKVFHKSTSVEVLHVDCSAHSKRPAGLEYVERKAALCYTGQTYCRADAGDSCSIDNDRAGDSGYPNSCSLHHDIDLDLTPEQVDDISSENGERSNQTLSDDEVSDASDNVLDLPRHPLQPHAPAIPIIFEDVENGDLANNNRDGEGNNAVAAVEDERVFEALVQEGEMQPLMAAPEADDVILPGNADPYPEWLKDLLGMSSESEACAVSAVGNTTPSDCTDPSKCGSSVHIITTSANVRSVSVQPLCNTSLVKSDSDEGLGDDTICWASEAGIEDKVLEL